METCGKDEMLSQKGDKNFQLRILEGIEKGDLSEQFYHLILFLMVVHKQTLIEIFNAHDKDQSIICGCH